MPASAVQIVLVTCSGREEGERIAEQLVERQLAACVNIVPSVTSVYKWEGKIHKDGEALLIIKSRKELFAKLRQAVTELHSYDLPEVIGLGLEDGFKPYLDWVLQNTKKD